jgi:hypothetical protein
MNSPRVSSTQYTKNPFFRIRNYFTRRRNSNNPKPVNNNRNKSFRTRNRRGAITYKNAARIRGHFQKPPVHPFRPKYIPPPPVPLYRRGPIYMNNNNNNDPINPY